MKTCQFVVVCLFVPLMYAGESIANSLLFWGHGQPSEVVLDLTGREFELLEMLLRHPHQVLTKEQLLNQVWGWEFEGNTNVVEVHMSALRTKLGDTDRKLIRTVRGLGYALGG